jgi:hypothetical protein
MAIIGVLIPGMMRYRFAKLIQSPFNQAATIGNHFTNPLGTIFNRHLTGSGFLLCFRPNRTPLPPNISPTFIERNIALFYEFFG